MFRANTVCGSRLPSVFTVNGGLCCICVFSLPLLSAAVHLKKTYVSLFNVPICYLFTHMWRQRTSGCLLPAELARSRAVSHTGPSATQRVLLAVSLGVCLFCCCCSLPFAHSTSLVQSDSRQGRHRVARRGVRLPAGVTPQDEWQSNLANKSNTWLSDWSLDSGCIIYTWLRL